jgi:hypothetical protein
MGRPKKNATSDTTSTRVAKKPRKKSATNATKEPSIEESILQLVNSGDVLSFCGKCNFLLELPKKFMSQDIICEHCKNKLNFEDVIFRSRASFIKC